MKNFLTSPGLLLTILLSQESKGFTAFHRTLVSSSSTVLFNKGFGGGGGAAVSKKKNKKTKKANRLINTLEDKPKAAKSSNKPFVRSEQDDLLEQLAAKTASTCIGQAVANAPVPPEGIDPFWELMPSLISSRFPNIPDYQLQRVAGMVQHSLDPNLPLEESIVNDPYRPHDEIHAYMPGLGDRTPFLDPDQVKLCCLLSENYDAICEEYEALIQDKTDRFQSVTSMNYEAGKLFVPASDTIFHATFGSSLYNQSPSFHRMENIGTFL